MANIHLLDPSVYNKISAGEVIEKPASVVKELVENALDAHATSITVSFSGGGLDVISVSDNGCGIAKDDLSSVFLPHATSKISTADDLFNIGTLGFRGEAMASIAAAAMVTLRSRQTGAEAYTISANGGQIGEVGLSSGAVGTDVEVRNLFYHTPARLKFLRSAKQEGRDIVAYCERFVIANPTVRFVVVEDGKEVLRTAGEGLAEAVRVVFGEDAFDHMLPIDTSEYGYSIRGYVSDTDLTAGTRANQITVLNGRVVQNANLSASINNAYRDFLMKRNYAMYALHITVPHNEVDVNVHPTKADVRFVYANKLFGLAYRVTRRAIEEYLQNRTIQFDTVSADNVATDVSEHIELTAPAQPRMTFAEDGDYFNAYNAVRRTGTFDVTPAPKPSAKADLPVFDEESPDLLGKISNDEPQKKVHEFDTTALRIVGQVLGTYIVAEYDGDMLLIDQHAAAERVLYNRLMRQYADKELVIQPMLIPYSFTLGEEDSALLSERLEDIKALGIEIVREGEGFALLSMPAILIDMDVRQFVHLILSEGFEGDGKHVLNERLAYAACRSAIKGNTYLDNESITLLCKSLFSGELPATCPHGRPAYVKISKYELEKMFKRIV